MPASFAPYILWIVFVIDNIAIMWLLKFILQKIDFSSVLAEKTASAPTAETPNTSFSRVSGIIGAVVLAWFFWAIGSIIIYDEFADPYSVATMLKGISTFLAAGAALFAPYAVNQLSAIFK